MPVDNALYDSEPWRDESRFLYTLSVLTPVRFGYMRDVLVNELRLNPQDMRALDVGCGGGFLAEEFARIGCAMTGIDPSAPSIAQAMAHGAEAGLTIVYHVAPGEAIPYADATFDIAYCCDVLEHVDDLDHVIAETARVLKPGGVYLFDTINRTRISKLVVIKLLQEWKATRVVTTNLHDWTMFITPNELRAALARHGLECRDIVGINPRGNPFRALRAFRQLKRGAISYAEIGARLPMAVGKRTPVQYAGYAIKSL
ncbi:MAG: bifunctional 2-polyprenyl-6-hydroxyphenol methylase/3-demethylubiquinol 3-O-methyltransferase UbiG [Thermomicrobia bacterium]|nr:bifunctional 2-polyprenyl-6-hydroxyphenol methylase/3-demethylubiquinol 3-O-methyltransferase UbiG [Thermomicrobia bacterium]MCA1724711.1 bifunctional 2-polyprenyl-6-hydroxyphenol methylase/3-demethylubiquinol 3-O-methyltransferase UbiG [Thermomicrobia bacterium]